MKEQYFSYKPIYTDGSKDGQAVSAAAVFRNKSKKCLLQFFNLYYRSEGN